MRILVINPPSQDKTINRDMAGGLGYSAGEGVILPPVDLLNQVTTLKKFRHKVYFVDAIAEKKDDFEYFKKFVINRKIEVVILGVALPTISEDCQFAKILKNNFPKIKIVCKTGISYRNILERIMEQSDADLLIFGECDLNINEYLSGKRKSACLRNEKGKVVYYPLTQGDRITNLDDLPFADREATKYKLYRYTLLPGIVTTMQTSRGCPYPCGYYCPYPLVQGKVWRAMSTDRVMAEIKSIKKLGIKGILFRDATFTLNKTRTMDFCKKMTLLNSRIKWWCETRINVLDEELLLQMKKAGCRGINVGIETLDQELIVNQGKPGVSLEQVVKIRELAKKIGVKLHFLMIIGLPDESLKTIYNTFDYLVKLRPESVGFSTITPYPGTEMFEMALKKGLIKKFEWSKFNGRISNMRTKFLSSWDMKIIRLILTATSYSLKRNSIFFEKLIQLNRYVLKNWSYIRG